ncbi:hypothetical protein HKCCE4037_06345 [Rhodobacterales bacterium HKCCE4037]|nr:hypothetical protein [Rhodobacterales bacterium HKCCE4037]
MSKNTRILLYSYSVLLGAWIPLLVLVVPEVLFWLFRIETSPRLLWCLAVLCAALVPWLRLRPQRGITDA